MSCKAITPLVSRYSSAFIQPTTTFDDIRNFASYTTLQNDPLAKYDDAQVIDIMIKLEKFSKVANKTRYPTLVDRITQAPLNPYEIADFLDQTQYDPSELQSTLNEAYNKTNFPDNLNNISDYPQLSSDVNDCLQQLDFYYNNNIANTIGGGFCAAFGNAFAQLTGLISLASSFAKKISDLINGDFSLVVILETIKKKIVDMIDNLKETLTKQLENIANQIKGYAQNIFNKLNNKVQALKDFFTDFSLESVKEKIEEFIAKAAGAFENLTLKNIAFLMFRFCQLTDLVQSFLQSPIKGLTEELGRYALFETIINDRSRSATMDAVAAGAKRISPQEIDRRRQELIERINSRDRDRRSPVDRSPSAGPASGSPGVIPSVSSFVTPTVTEEERAWLQTITSAGASGYFTFGDGVTSMSSKAIARYESGSSNPPRELYDRSHHYPDAGWREVVRNNPYCFIGLKRVMDMMYERYGTSEFGPVSINSAYRSPYYNRMIGGARESIHMSAGAIDVGTRFDREARGYFVKFASQQGFKGIGVYSTFTHLDLSNSRRWIAGWSFNGRTWVRARSDYPIPSGDVQFWSETLARHVSNSYRNSVEVPSTQSDTVTDGPVNSSPLSEPLDTSPPAQEEDLLFIDADGTVLNPESDPQFTALHNEYLARARRATGRT